MTEVTLNINSLILGFGLFRRKSWLYASSCISQVSHVTFVPPRCTRVVWTSGQVVAWQVPLSTRLENRTGFSQILKRRLLKPSHCPLIVCILFSGRKWNHECIKLKWSSHISECGALYFIKVYTVYEQCSWFCQKGLNLVQLFGAGWVQKGVGGIFLKIRPHSSV